MWTFIEIILKYICTYLFFSGGGSYFRIVTVSVYSKPSQRAWKLTRNLFPGVRYSASIARSCDKTGVLCEATTFALSCIIRHTLNCLTMAVNAGRRHSHTS